MACIAAKLVKRHILLIWSGNRLTCLYRGLQEAALSLPVSTEKTGQLSFLLETTQGVPFPLRLDCCVFKERQ